MIAILITASIAYVIGFIAGILTYKMLKK